MLRINRYGQPKDESAICPYSETMVMQVLLCKGDTNPVRTTTPIVAHAIYYDSANNKCYYSTSGDSSADWTEFPEPLYCPISQSDSPLNVIILLEEVAYLTKTRVQTLLQAI